MEFWNQQTALEAVCVRVSRVNKTLRYFGLMSSELASKQEITRIGKENKCRNGSLE